MSIGVGQRVESGIALVPGFLHRRGDLRPGGCRVERNRLLFAFERRAGAQVGADNVRHAGAEILYLGSRLEIVVLRRPASRDSGASAAFGTLAEASPYPGAKPHYLVTDRLDHTEWLSLPIATTAHELPQPKQKKKRQKK